MRRHAFFKSDCGTTSLSASGICLPPGTLTNGIVPGGSSCLVLTVGSLIQPFLRLQPGRMVQSGPRLLPSATIDVLMETWLDASGEAATPWHPATLLAMVEVPLASAAVSALMGGGGWDHNWALAAAAAAQTGSQVASSGDEPTSSTALVPAQHVEPTVGIQVAVLQVAGRAVPAEEELLVGSAAGLRQGCQVAAFGSPFGLLLPTHFFNSMARGVVSNTWPPGGSTPAILVTDMHCLPGMEGGPVVEGGEEQRVVGMLLPPLRHLGSGTQVQLAATWDVISASLHISPPPPPPPYLTACPTHALQFPPARLNPDPSLSTHCAYTKGCPNQAVLDAARSVVLVRVGMGSWASGVVLSCDGLILTNAHLVDPDRFRGPPSLPHTAASHTAAVSFLEASSVDGAPRGVGGRWRRRPSLTSAEGIRVRVGEVGAARWHSATVIYVSRGPLDVALLQVEGAMGGLTAICPEMLGANEGETAVVVGHGLFGPDTHLPASLTAGVVSKVVHLHPCPTNPSLSGGRQVAFPAQLQTSAAVHAGNSGGAVVNGNGKMIGLVTSNARHNGLAVLPRLNFSIPCEMLGPVFAFAASGNRDLSQLSSLDSPDPGLAKIWALVQSPPSATQAKQKFRAGAEGAQSVERGAKFRAFMSEGSRPLSRSLKSTSQDEGVGGGREKSLESVLDSNVSVIGNRVADNGSCRGDSLGREFLHARL